MKKILKYSSAYPILGKLRSDALNEESVNQFLDYSSTDTSKIPSFLQSEVLKDEVITGDYKEFPANVQYYLYCRRYLLIKRLSRFIKGKEFQFLRIFEFYLLFYTLKDLVRRIISGDSFNFSEAMFFELTGEHFDIKEGTTFDSLDSLADITKYSDVNDKIEFALNAYEGSEEQYYGLEIALDIGYLQLLWEHLQALGFSDRRRAEKILGPYIAAKLFKWSIELKQEYEMIPSRIINYMFFPEPYLSESVFWKYIEEDAISSLIEALPPSDFGKYLVQYSDEIKELSDILFYTRKFQWELVKLRPIGYPFNIVTFVQFIINQEIVVRDLLYIAQALKFGKSRNEIKKNLITKEAGR